MFRIIEQLRDIRLRGRPAIVGGVILGIFLLSLLVFLLAGNGQVERVLYFPREHGRGFIAEPRYLSRHRGLVDNITELVNGVLLGPSRFDAVRLFPRGATVRAAMLRGHTLYLDLTSAVLAQDPDVPLSGPEAFRVLDRSIRFNFPGVHQIVLYIDGQVPRFPAKKNI